MGLIQYLAKKWLKQLDLPAESKELVARLWCVWFCVITGWAMLQATVPMVLKESIGGPGAAKYQGILTATTATSGLLLGTVVGYVSDRRGRLAVLAPWCIAFSVGTLFVLLAYELQLWYLLIPARLPALSLPMTLIFALTSDFASGPTLLQVHGLLGTSFAVALLFGSVFSAGLGQLFREQAYELTMQIASAFALLGAAIVWRTPADVPILAAANGTDSTPPSSPAIGSPSTVMKATPASYWSALKLIGKDPLLLCLVFGFAIVRAGNVFTMLMFVLFTNFRLGWGLPEASLTLGFVGSLAVAWQSLGVRWVSKRFPENVHPTILLGLLLMYPILMMGYAMSKTPSGLFLAASLGSISSMAPSLFTSKITTLASQDGLAGSALGVVGSLTCLLELPCSALFSYVLSYTLAHVDKDDTLAGLPFFLNAGWYALSFLFVLWGDRRFGTGRLGWRSPQSLQPVLNV